MNSCDAWGADTNPPYGTIDFPPYDWYVIPYNSLMTAKGTANDDHTGDTGVRVVQVFDNTPSPPKPDPTPQYLFDASLTCGTNYKNCTWSFNLQFPGSYLQPGDYYTFRIKIWDRINPNWPYTGSYSTNVYRTICLAGTEVLYNGKDDDCNPNTKDNDLDGDGYNVPADCNDSNASINPGANDVCDGQDNDCNTGTGDGSGESWYGSACDGGDTDLCNEGTYQCTNGSQACSDATGNNTEVCDGQDNDCNAGTSDGSGESWYGSACDGTDTDLCNEGTYQCTNSSQTCSDATGNNTEICNTIDDNCNGQTDEGVQNSYYQDADTDTYGNASVSTQACTQPSGYVPDNTDCNDANTSVYPGALEVCNGVDDNCNIEIDENVTYTFYADLDGDGYGDPGNSTLACTLPSGYVADNTDCNDNDPNVYPGAPETTNDGIDQDCSGFDLSVEGAITGATGNQQSHTVAWNPVATEYLVLWQDFRNGASNPDIYGARLDAQGNVVAGDIPVVTQAAKQAGPWVAHGSSGGDYLAVWIDQRNMSISGTDVYGVWISDSGTVGSEFVITDAPANQRAASVVYNPSADNFLVTWIDDSAGATDLNIWGAAVSPGGGVSSGPFAMVTASGNQRGPYVRYDYGNSQYFMVWFDDRNGNYDVYGSRVTSGGVLSDGSGVVITSATGDQKNPRITDRDPLSGTGNYVLSWIDFRNGQADIYGALSDEFGTRIGSDIEIAGGSYDQRAASIDVDYVRTGQAVVSWIDNRNGTDL